MNKNEFEKSGINYEEGINRFMKKEDLFIRFLLKFKDDKSYDRLKEAIDNNDFDSAFKESHTLKGVAANLSMTALAKAASDVTEEFRLGNNENGKMLMTYVDEAYLMVSMFLELLEKEA